MNFKKCSIKGIIYDEDMKPGSLGYVNLSHDFRRDRNSHFGFFENNNAMPFGGHLL
jgi:hypothetical protein